TGNPSSLNYLCGRAREGNGAGAIDSESRVIHGARRVTPAVFLSYPFRRPNLGRGRSGSKRGRFPTARSGTGHKPGQPPPSATNIPTSSVSVSSWVKAQRSGAPYCAPPGFRTNRAATMGTTGVVGFNGRSLTESQPTPHSHKGVVA